MNEKSNECEKSPRSLNDAKSTVTKLAPLSLLKKWQHLTFKAKQG
jgi:hypothetical protein